MIVVKAEELVTANGSDDDLALIGTERGSPSSSGGSATSSGAGVDIAAEAADVHVDMPSNCEISIAGVLLVGGVLSRKGVLHTRHREGCSRI
jgi:hypothetical protein